MRSENDAMFGRLCHNSEALILHKHVHMKRPNAHRWVPGIVVLALSSVLASAQTHVTPPSNKYALSDDVKLGQDAAREMRAQLPILNDEEVTSYVEGLGRRLVNAIPRELQHPEFRYSFEVVNVRDINASALPGGPTFVNRGMIETAATEGEIAGVMAHELSHVALRHGTAQASKAGKYEAGSVLGQIAGAIIGGGWGQVVSGVSQFGFGTAFLRFSREYEKQADIEGAQIMAAAGYDPHDMANVFRRLEKENGGSGPQWMSDHPNPGNRVEYIEEEARRLHVENAVRDTRAFEQAQSHLKRLPRAPTTEEAVKQRGRSTGTSGRDVPRPSGRVQPPSSRYQTYREGNLFQIAVPSNWRELPNNNTVTFAPDGAYAEGVFTHGIQVGVARNESHDLEEATDELLQSLAQGNRLSRPSGYDRVSIGGRRGLRTVVTNANADGSREGIQVFTAQLQNGNLFYALGVAPQNTFDSYRDVFDRVASSIRFTEY
jgi:beta-barrel assembly-enhancing protease